jgi:hypothetical protein
MRNTLSALALLGLVATAAAGCAETTARTAQATPRTAPAALPMQIGQRVQLGPMMEGRIVREVMVSQGGGGLIVVYDNPPGQPESRRVLRLENNNGMQEVVYDTAMPSTMGLGSSGTPRLVQTGGGMYSVEYDRPGTGAAQGGRAR